jgi:hypothetical protein
MVYYYVRRNGDDTKDGLSLLNAKQSLHSAINSASDGDVIVIEDGLYSLSSVSSLTKRVQIQSMNGVAVLYN